MKIRAAVAVEKQAPFIVEECELDPPGPGEVLVEIRAAGICHTDLTVKDVDLGVQLPAVLGHEGAGVVREVGAGVTEFAEGDEVVASFGACGACPSCKAEAPAYCQHVLTLNGRGVRIDGSSPVRRRGERITGHFFAQSSFASHAVVSTVNLVKKPAGIPFEHAAPLACGVQTGAGSVFHVLGAGAGDTLLVLGCGTVGLAAVMAGRIAGCARIIAVDLRRSRIELARELGATDGIDSSAEPLAEALAALGGATCAVDTTGAAPVVEAAFHCLHPRGRLVCVGVSATGASLSINMNELLMTGRSVRGTIEGDSAPRTFLPRLFDAYASGRLPVDRLVRTYPLDAINEAAADMLAGRVVKPVLVPQEPPARASAP